MTEVRCSNCRRLLARGNYSAIEIKCPRCKAHNIFSNQKAVSLRLERPGASNEMEVSNGNTDYSD